MSNIDPRIVEYKNYDDSIGMNSVEEVDFYTKATKPANIVFKYDAKKALKLKPDANEIFKNNHQFLRQRALDGLVLAESVNIYTS